MRSDLPGEVLLEEFKAARELMEHNLRAQSKPARQPADQEADPESLG